MIYLVFAWNLALTVAAEGVVMWLLFRRRDYVYYSFLANAITNPSINLILFFCVGNLGWSYLPVLAVLEIMALTTETLIFYKICSFGTGLRGWGIAAGVSLLLNGMSYAAGVFINELVF